MHFLLVFNFIFMLSGYNKTIKKQGVNDMKKLSLLFLLGCMICLTGCSTNASQKKSTYEISEEEAKTNVFHHFNVEEKDVLSFHAMKKSDDGIQLYEIHFSTNSNQYEADVNRQNGEILDTDIEPILISNTNDTNTLLSEEDALQRAYQHAKIDANQVTDIYVHQDHDDGITYYEIEFNVGVNHYEMDVNQTNGSIKDYSIEPLSSTASLTKDEIYQILQNKVNGINPNEVELELDDDHGNLIYEGEFYFNDKEYEFEINANDGTILKWNVENID